MKRDSPSLSFPSPLQAFVGKGRQTYRSLHQCEGYVSHLRHPTYTLLVIWLPSCWLSERSLQPSMLSHLRRYTPHIRYNHGRSLKATLTWVLYETTYDAVSTPLHTVPRRHKVPAPQRLRRVIRSNAMRRHNSIGKHDNASTRRLL